MRCGPTKCQPQCWVLRLTGVSSKLNVAPSSWSQRFPTWHAHLSKASMCPFSDALLRNGGLLYAENVLGTQLPASHCLREIKGMGRGEAGRAIFMTQTSFLSSWARTPEISDPRAFRSRGVPEGMVAPVFGGQSPRSSLQTQS